MKHILLLLVVATSCTCNTLTQEAKKTTNEPYATMLDKRTEILTGQKPAPRNPRTIPALTQQISNFSTQLEALETQLKNL